MGLHDLPFLPLGWTLLDRAARAGKPEWIGGSPGVQRCGSVPALRRVPKGPLLAIKAVYQPLQARLRCRRPRPTGLLGDRSVRVSG